MLCHLRCCAHRIHQTKEWMTLSKQCWHLSKSVYLDKKMWIQSFTTQYSVILVAADYFWVYLQQFESCGTLPGIKFKMDWINGFPLPLALAPGAASVLLVILQIIIITNNYYEMIWLLAHKYAVGKHDAKASDQCRYIYRHGTSALVRSRTLPKLWKWWS